MRPNSALFFRKFDLHGATFFRRRKVLCGATEVPSHSFVLLLRILVVSSCQLQDGIQEKRQMEYGISYAIHVNGIIHTHGPSCKGTQRRTEHLLYILFKPANL